jgi:hypothetical protein
MIAPANRPAIEVDFSLPGERVVCVLDDVAAGRGYPRAIVGGVAGRLQRRSAAQRPRRSNPDGVCQSTAADETFLTPTTGLT